jgi:putative tryptophan/tyrosine transport system substrate-binding protein
MLLSVKPKLFRVAILMNPTNSSSAAILGNVQAAAQKIGLRVLPLKAQNPREIESAFASMTKEHVGAVIIATDSTFQQQQRQIAELAVKHHLPSIVAIRQYVEAGCLMSYGPSFAGNVLRSATYVDKIFKGSLNRLTCPSSSPRYLNWLLTARPPRCSASRFQTRFLCAPTV